MRLLVSARRQRRHAPPPLPRPLPLDRPLRGPHRRARPRPRPRLRRRPAHALSETPGPAGHGDRHRHRGPCRPRRRSADRDCRSRPRAPRRRPARWPPLRCGGGDGLSVPPASRPARRLPRAGRGLPLRDLRPRQRARRPPAQPGLSAEARRASGACGGPAHGHGLRDHRRPAAHAEDRAAPLRPAAGDTHAP